MSASRWQRLPVVICTTGAPVPCSRRASLSVARSPTTTAALTRSRGQVACNNAVLPEPGDDSTLTTYSPRHRNASRFRAAASAFLTRRFLVTLMTRGPAACSIAIVGHLQAGQLQFLPGPHVPAQGPAAGTREDEILGGKLLPASAAGADDRHRLDLKRRPLGHRPRRHHVEGERQRLDRKSVVKGQSED